MIKPQHKHIIIRALCEKPPRDCDVAVEEYKQFDREYAIKEETNGFKEIY